MILSILICIIIPYLFASTPFGLVLVKKVHKVDIRSIGSGNIGATNVYRAGYKKLALITFLLDSSKGVLPVIIAMLYFDGYIYAMTIASIFAVLGHIYPIYTKFKGGKGISTIIGVLVVNNYIIAMLFVVTWISVFLISRLSSLAAICSLVVINIFSYYISHSLVLTITIFIISAISIYKHKDNIKRLINKSECKL